MSHDDSDDVRLRTAVAAWSRAEESVMGTLRFDPTIYQAALGVMARLLDHLRTSVGDLAGLLAAEHDPAVVALAIEDPPSVVEPETAVAAALAIRYRELAYQVRLAERLATVAEARAAGDDWAHIVEPPPGGSGAHGSGPGSELVVHLPSGLGVTATTEFHLDTGSILFIARPVHVDLQTGAIAGPAHELGEERVASTRAELEDQVAEIVAAIQRWTAPP